MKNVTQKEWEQKVALNADAIIIDVRTEQECAHGVIENAHCIDFFLKDAFVTALNNMDKTKSYYVYCRSGQRSANACSIMDDMGFKETYNLVGGISNWTGKIV